MSTEQKQRSSEGAVRAGKAIYDLCREAAIKAGARTGGQVLADNYALCAEIIEGETHAGEMLEALERIASDQLWQSSRDGSDFAYKVRNIARESVRRARGGE